MRREPLRVIGFLKEPSWHLGKAGVKGRAASREGRVGLLPVQLCPTALRPSGPIYKRRRFCPRSVQNDSPENWMGQTASLCLPRPWKRGRRGHSWVESALDLSGGRCSCIVRWEWSTWPRSSCNSLRSVRQRLGARRARRGSALRRAVFVSAPVTKGLSPKQRRDEPRAVSAPEEQTGICLVHRAQGCHARAWVLLTPLLPARRTALCKSLGFPICEVGIICVPRVWNSHCSTPSLLPSQAGRAW